MRILSVRHITTYRYKQPVGFGEHRMMLCPREDHEQRLLELELEITPKPALLRRSRDVFGNPIASAHFSGRAATLRFKRRFRLEPSPTEFVDADIDGYARNCPFVYVADDMPRTSRRASNVTLRTRNAYTSVRRSFCAAAGRPLRAPFLKAWRAAPTGHSTIRRGMKEEFRTRASRSKAAAAAVVIWRCS
jgi:transglutaminase-like putative cysteine protease